MDIGNRRIVAMEYGGQKVTRIDHGTVNIFNAAYNDFAYLSYFNNVDIDTMSDTPVIGSKGNIAISNGTCVQSSYSIFGGTYPSLTYTNPDEDGLNQNSITSIPANSTLDFFASWTKSSTASEPSYIRLGSGFLVTLQFNYSYAPELLIRDGLSYTLHNNAFIRNEGWGVKFVNFNNSRCVATTNHHYAFVFGESTVKFFFDGILYATVNTTIPETALYIDPRNGETLQLTQLAVRYGDKSNGTSFSVPAAPYYPLL